MASATDDDAVGDSLFDAVAALRDDADRVLALLLQIQEGRRSSRSVPSAAEDRGGGGGVEARGVERTEPSTADADAARKAKRARKKRSNRKKAGKHAALSGDATSRSTLVKSIGDSAWGRCLSWCSGWGGKVASLLLLTMALLGRSQTHDVGRGVRKAPRARRERKVGPRATKRRILQEISAPGTDRDRGGDDAPRCDADPQSCGCPDVRQVDYRGTVAITESGLECLPWDELTHFPPDFASIYIWMLSVAGTGGNNYCRNPFGDERAGCFTADDEGAWEYCDVPACPSLESALASVDPYEAVPPDDGDDGGDDSGEAFHCDADPQSCGCMHIGQADYRGTIAESESGAGCRPWDDLAFIPPEYRWAFIEAGAEGNNYCRNHPESGYDRAGCFTSVTEIQWEYCNVPACPSSGIAPSNYQGNDDEYDRDDDTYYFDGDYSGGGYGDPIWLGVCSTIEPCPSGQYCNFDDGSDGRCESCARFLDGRSCRDDGLPIRGDTDCALRCECPADDDEDDCKCETLKSACIISMMNNETEFCKKAEGACCGEDEDCKCAFWRPMCKDQPAKIGYCAEMELAACCNADDDTCSCSIYEPLCQEYPSQFCGSVPKSCCGVDNPYSVNKFCGDGQGILGWSCNDHDYEEEVYIDPHCACDFYTSQKKTLGYQNDTRVEACFYASRMIPNYEDDLSTLRHIYESFNGDNWFNKTGWDGDSNDGSYCDRAGIKCNDKGFVSEIDLRGNNLSGVFDEKILIKAFALESLKLAENHISGMFRGNYFSSLRKLAHIDVSQNALSGLINILDFPAAEHLNFSKNRIESVTHFKQFSPAYSAVRVLDLRDNEIDQDAANIFRAIPPNLVELYLSNNDITGEFPNPPPMLGSLRVLAMDGNGLGGSLPDFPRYMPRLRDINLSKQRADAGLSGPIPPGLSNLLELTRLDLSGNNLENGIPADVGYIAQLKVLNLSSNNLSSAIPNELGKLGGALEVFDLSYNDLTGKIPFELGNLRNAAILLSGNPDLSRNDLAPLTLCATVADFDLKDNTALCPTERNVLRQFYVAAKGQEWTKNDLWLDEYPSHCDWHGVDCDSTKNTVQLRLGSNGLSGTLGTEIGNLSSLEVIELHDNDLKGSIPTELGLLSKLTRLRLNANSFVGDKTSFGALRQLQLIHLHGNRLSGTIPPLHTESAKFLNESSYIADCGSPSEFDESLNCSDCTMCCNHLGDCYPQNEDLREQIGFKNYTNFSLFFLLMSFLLCCALAFASFAYDLYKIHHSHLPRGSTTLSESRDNKYALSKIGDGSVYQFLLGKSRAGWLLVIVIMVAQILLLWEFVKGSEIDLSSDKVDLVYIYKCSIDRDACRNTADLTWQGWAAFGILMVSHLLKDIICGIRLVVLSGKERHKFWLRVKYFFGGVLLVVVSLFTCYVSTIYNSAIATKNTEIIVNSVVILFITDIDEKLYDILIVINEDWLKGMSQEEMVAEEKSDEEAVVGERPSGESEQAALVREQNEMLREQNLLLMEQIEELKGQVQGRPQDGSVAAPPHRSNLFID